MKKNEQNAHPPFEAGPESLGSRRWRAVEEISPNPVVFTPAAAPATKKRAGPEGSALVAQRAEVIRPCRRDGCPSGRRGFAGTTRPWCPASCRHPVSPSYAAAGRDEED